MYKQPIALFWILLLLFFLIGDIAVLVYFGYASWDNRIGFILQIIGFYGIGMGFIQKSDLLKNFISINEDMTSPNLFRFIRGNAYFLALLLNIFVVALGVKRSTKSSQSLGCLGEIFFLCLSPFIFIYVLFHFVVIIPFAYIGYLIASALVESITGSGEDVIWKITLNENQEKKMSIREIIASNPAATKSFLIGIPAAVLAIIVKGIGIFLKR